MDGTLPALKHRHAEPVHYAQMHKTHTKWVGSAKRWALADPTEQRVHQVSEHTKK